MSSSDKLPIIAKPDVRTQSAAEEEEDDVSGSLVVVVGNPLEKTSVGLRQSSCDVEESLTMTDLEVLAGVTGSDLGVSVAGVVFETLGTRHYSWV